MRSPSRSYMLWSPEPVLRTVKPEEPILFPLTYEASRWHKHIADSIRDDVREEVKNEYGLYWIDDNCHCPAVWQLDKENYDLKQQLATAEMMRRQAETTISELRIALEDAQNQVAATPAQVRAGHAATCPLALSDNHSVEVADIGDRIVSVLAEYGVTVSVDSRIIGPTSTRYLLRIGAGSKPKDVSRHSDELGMHLGAVRVLGPVPGTGCVGVEVLNEDRRLVTLGDVHDEDGELLNVVLGVSADNEPVRVDLAKMPHTLVAGQTGSGKSSVVNAVIAQLLYRDPLAVQLAMVDMKRVELAAYADVPHLWRPIAQDADDALQVLSDAADEVDRRYQEMVDLGVKDFAAYRAREAVPALLIVVDEMAELMLSDYGKATETLIQRIAQLGRAAGVHLILSTQRPTVDVATGLIKANVPGRIGFATASGTDSRVILDRGGCETLAGAGDGLLLVPGSRDLVRFQSAYVDDETIDAIAGSTR